MIVLEALQNGASHRGSDFLNQDRGNLEPFSQKQFAVFVDVNRDTFLSYPVELFRDDFIRMQTLKSNFVANLTITGSIDHRARWPAAASLLLLEK